MHIVIDIVLCISMHIISFLSILYIDGDVTTLLSQKSRLESNNILCEEQAGFRKGYSKTVCVHNAFYQFLVNKSINYTFSV